MATEMKKYRVSFEREVLAENPDEAMRMGTEIVNPDYYQRGCVRDIDGGESHGDIVRIHDPN